MSPSTYALLPARLLALAALCWITMAPPAFAQAQNESEAERLFRSIPWQQGPCAAKLGDMAEIQVPAGMAFTGQDGTKKWMDATRNLYHTDMLGIVVPMSEANWWVIFEYNDVGHIKDDDKDKLDANAILKSIRDGNKEANKMRRKKGWPESEVVGWDKAPFYDPNTNNLTWAIRGKSPGGESVNYSVRLLGRKGYMSADMVIAPEDLAQSIGSFDSLLAGYTYTSGNRYAEFREGDKLAAYGLTALVAGGAGAIAAKTGLLAKFWKVIVVAVMALVAGARRFFGALFNWNKRAEGPTQPPTGSIQ